MKPVIVLGIANGVVECISNPTNVDIILHDFDIQDTDNLNFEYGNDGDNDFMVVRFPGEITPAEDRYGKDVKPDNKEKSLAQYLDEYIEHEVELDNIESADMYAYNSWRELFEQALNAYESTEQVKIRIEKAR